MYVPLLTGHNGSEEQASHNEGSQGATLRDYRLKCAILGDYAVGKTTFLNAITARDLVHAQFPSTIAVEFSQIAVKLPHYPGHIVQLHMWDTAGTERYKAIIRSYLRNNAMVLVAFDFGNRTSWDNVDMWRDFILRLSDDFTPMFSLLGCKADTSKPLVTDEEIALKATEWGKGCQVFKFSAFDNDAQQCAQLILSTLTERVHDNILKHGTRGMGHTCCSLVPVNGQTQKLSIDDPEPRRTCLKMNKCCN